MSFRYDNTTVFGFRNEFWGGRRDVFTGSVLRWTVPVWIADRLILGRCLFAYAHSSRAEDGARWYHDDESGIVGWRSCSGFTWCSGFYQSSSSPPSSSPSSLFIVYFLKRDCKEPSRHRLRASTLWRIGTSEQCWLKVDRNRLAQKAAH